MNCKKEKQRQINPIWNHISKVSQTYSVDVSDSSDTISKNLINRCVYTFKEILPHICDDQIRQPYRINKQL